MDRNIEIRAENMVHRWEESYGVYANLSKKARNKLIYEISREMESSWLDGLREGERQKNSWGDLGNGYH